MTVWTNTLVTPAHGGITKLGYHEGEDSMAASVPEVAGEHSVGKTGEEWSSGAECNVRLGVGLRGGTHIVNITLLLPEVTGTSSTHLLITVVEDEEKVESMEKLVYVSANVTCN